MLVPLAANHYTLGFFVEIVTEKISASPSTSPSASKHPLVLPSDEEEYWDTHFSGSHRKMPVYLPFGGPLDDARVGCCTSGAAKAQGQG